MKILLLFLLAILALNALVIVGVAFILWADHWRSKRKKESEENVRARTS